MTLVVYREDNIEVLGVLAEQFPDALVTEDADVAAQAALDGSVLAYGTQALAQAAVGHRLARVHQDDHPGQVLGLFCGTLSHERVAEVWTQGVRILDLAVVVDVTNPASIPYLKRMVSP